MRDVPATAAARTPAISSIPPGIDDAATVCVMESRRSVDEFRIRSLLGLYRANAAVNGTFEIDGLDFG